MCACVCVSKECSLLYFYKVCVCHGKNVTTSFVKKIYSVNRPGKRSVFRMVGKLWMTASVLGRDKIQKVVFFLDQL